jgi:hypothetical protein
MCFDCADTDLLCFGFCALLHNFEHKKLCNYRGRDTQWRMTRVSSGDVEKCGSAAAFYAQKMLQFTSTLPVEMVVVVHHFTM